MTILAVIPARGGSKGIPHKNIVSVHDKPLLAYTIEQARATPAIDRVIVSTDSSAIATVATKYGAEVAWRPTEISGDKASSEAALLHVLDHLRDREHYTPDLLVFLQATSPMRQPDDIQNAINTLYRENADSLLSVTPFHGFLWRKLPTGPQSISYNYQHRQMRQDAPEDFVENGSIYVVKTEVLRANNNRLGGKIALYPMRALDSFQIDEPDDITLIEHLMSLNDKPLPDFSAVRALILDFDGVMTDNRVLVDQDGHEAVMVHRGDGWGIARLLEAGMPVYVISTEKNPVVAARCRKLNIAYFHGQDDKLTTLQNLAHELGITPGQLAYLGNDVNDLTCMEWVGLPIAVADAVTELKRLASWITRNPGGYGAVREVADQLLKANIKKNIES